MILEAPGWQRENVKLLCVGLTYFVLNVSAHYAAGWDLGEFSAVLRNAFALLPVPVAVLVVARFLWGKGGRASIWAVLFFVQSLMVAFGINGVLAFGPR